LGTTSKSHRIESYKFWSKFKFESSLNFKGVQTFLEKHDKFSKIPSSHSIVEYEFTLTHLYSNIGSSFTSGKRYLVYFIPHKSWPLRYIAPTITSTPLYQIGQGVFETRLGVLCFHPVDMHTPSLKIEEDIEFPKVITAKQMPEN
jgi:hypothetical protein